MINPDVFAEQSTLVASADPVRCSEESSNQSQITQTDIGTLEEDSLPLIQQMSSLHKVPDHARSDEDKELNRQTNPYTGVEINVTDDSWLAWFKNLASPSPVSQIRNKRSDSSTKSKSSINLINSVDQDRRKAFTVPSEEVYHEDSRISSCQNDETLQSSESDISNHRTKTIATQSTLLATDSTQAVFPNQVLQDETTVGFLPKTQNLFKTFGNKVNQSMLIPISLNFKREWFRVKNWLKNHIRISIAIGSLILSLIVVIILLLVFFVIIPNRIQKAIDQTVLDLAHATITEPSDDEFTIEVESNIQRNFGTPVSLKEFEATVRYAPFPAFRSQYQHLLNADSDGLITQKPIGNNKAHRVLIDEYNYNQLISNTRGRQLQDSVYTRDKGKDIYYNLGRMVIPEQRISGFTSTSSYTSTFVILDLTLFEVFLKELMTLGHSNWVIVGHPAVTIMGITFRGSLFEKSMPVHGPKLHITKEEFIISIAEQSKHDLNKALWWKDINENLTMIDSKIETSTQLPNVTIPLINLTGSTEDVVRLHLQVEMENGEGVGTVDPVGAMTVQTQYRNQPIIELTSKKETKLKPGLNLIDFFGDFTPIDRSTKERHEAMIDLFSRMFRGETPLLETSGVTNSIPLFAPAIEIIHLYTFLDLLKNTRVKDGISNGIPIVQEMKLETLQLIQNPKNSSEIGIKGKLLAVISNPLGSNSPIEVSMVKLVGHMLMPMEDTTTFGTQVPEERTVMCDFFGSLQGVGKSVQTYTENGSAMMSQIGAIPVSVQKIGLDINFVLSLTNKGLEFQKFVQLYVKQKILELSLVNVTATLLTKSALGPLELRDIPLDQNLTLIGFNGLKNVTLSHFSIEGIPYITNNGDEGFNIEVGVMIPTEAAADIYLGTLFVNLRYQGSRIAYLSAPRCRIAPGYNYMNFTGQARLREIEFSKILSFTANYMNGRGNDVEVELIQSIPDHNSTTIDGQSLAPDWLRYALVGLTFKVHVPGARMANNGNGLFGNGGLLGLLSGGRPSSRSETLTDEPQSVDGSASEVSSDRLPRIGGRIFGGVVNELVNGFEALANAAMRGH